MNTKEELLKKHDKLIRSTAAQYATHVPLAPVLAQAYKLASKAADTYDPKSGNQFSTHLVNSLQKLSRISTTYGGMLRLPENKQFALKKLNDAEEELRADLGRVPTASELSQFTGMHEKKVVKILKSKQKEVNLANLMVMPTFVDSENDEWIQFVYHDLPPTDKLIMEYSTGMSGRPVLSKEDIAKKVNLSYATVCQRLRLIQEKLAQGWKNQ